MKLPLCSCLLFGLVVTAVAHADDSAKLDLKKLQGTWAVIQIKDDGIDVSPEVPLSFVVSGKKVSVYHDKMLKAESSLRLDSGTSPKHLDLVSCGNGRTARAVYELTGDTLTICFDARDEGRRPDRFSGGPGYRLVVLQRKAPG